MLRRSDELNARLQGMPEQDKARAIVMAAARNGKSQADLVRIIVQQVTGVKTLEKAKEISAIWGPRINLKPERFAELAEKYLNY